MRIILFALIFIAWPFVALSAPAGTVTFVQGKVFATTSSNETKVLSRRAEVMNGDTIITEPDAIVQFRMSDGSNIALQPNTTFKIDHYQYDSQDDGSERAFYSLVKGALRTVTGAIGRKNKKNYQTSTPTSTIGIRGTAFALRFDGATLVTVGEGAINFCNQSKCLDLFAGQSGIVVDKNSSPTITTKSVVQEDKERKSLSTLAVLTESSTTFKPNDTPELESLIAASSSVTLPSFVNTPLISGSGGMPIFAQGASGIGAGLAGVNMVFDGNGVLTSWRDSTNVTSGADLISNGESFADGIIAWGRWSSGTATGSLATQTGNPLGVFHYTANLSATSTPAGVLSSLSGTYTAFGSTAPTISNASGVVIQSGSPNSVVGSLNVNFAGGTVGYNLSIPLPSQTFTMSGIANFVTPPTTTDSRFLGGGSITSTGSACSSTCTGVIPFGPNIAGTISGLNGERAGAVYGFDSTLGKVSGAVVFKK
ncbi:MAG: FecR family protein [Methylotenera sp.]|nr:FecR family protein [Methylotenera sp.]